MRFYSEELEGAILLRGIEFGRNYSFALQGKTCRVGNFLMCRGILGTLEGVRLLVRGVCWVVVPHSLLLLLLQRGTSAAHAATSSVVQIINVEKVTTEYAAGE